MRVLGLDPGTRRIGTALSDPGGTIALPLGVVERTGSKQDLAALAQLVRDHDVKRVVIGLPIHMDGRIGKEAKAAKALAAALCKETGIPVETQDERWTSVEAERTLASTATGRGRSRRREEKRRERVDALAATLILRTYLARLDSMNDDSGPSR